MSCSNFRCIAFNIETFPILKAIHNMDHAPFGVCIRTTMACVWVNDHDLCLRLTVTAVGLPIHARKKLPRSVPSSVQYQVNISVISEGGSRVDIFTREREAMTTGSYRPGFCYVEGFLSAGTYTIVVSTYKPGQVRAAYLKNLQNMVDFCYY